MTVLQQRPTTSIPNMAELNPTLIPENSISTAEPTKQRNVKQQASNPRPKPKIELLELKDYKKAARTLYQAFSKDKVALYCSRHLEKDPELRRKCDIMLFEAFVYSYVLEGVVLVVKGDSNTDGDDSTFETVALWATPESQVETYTTMVRSGFAKFAWMTGSEGRKREKTNSIFGHWFILAQHLLLEVKET
ncbi:unnamed protein product [Ambrosiozyma monospora]|uniref:Unnamed protein product n=1 Tax=Ambrosiozyma monospora TaxID=43982 RepID=A0ACB5UCY9_AMBMO|nr:unnamed protein product [Ambrosiozyma monospora]